MVSVTSVFYFQVKYEKKFLRKEIYGNSIQKITDGTKERIMSKEELLLFFTHCFIAVHFNALGIMNHGDVTFSSEFILFLHLICSNTS